MTQTGAEEGCAILFRVLMFVGAFIAAVAIGLVIARAVGW